MKLFKALVLGSLLGLSAPSFGNESEKPTTTNYAVAAGKSVYKMATNCIKGLVIPVTVGTIAASTKFITDLVYSIDNYFTAPLNIPSMLSEGILPPQLNRSLLERLELYSEHNNKYLKIYLASGAAQKLTIAHTQLALQVTGISTLLYALALMLENTTHDEKSLADRMLIGAKRCARAGLTFGITLGVLTVGLAGIATMSN